MFVRHHPSSTDRAANLQQGLIVALWILQYSLSNFVAEYDDTILQIDSTIRFILKGYFYGSSFFKAVLSACRFST